MEWNKVNLNNLFSLYQDIARVYPGTSIHNFERFKVVKTPGAEWPNIAFGINEENLDERIALSIDKEMVNLEMNPFFIANYTPESQEKFKGNRFRPIEQWQGMFLDNLGKIKVPEFSDQYTFFFPDEHETEIWTDLVSETLFRSKYLNHQMFSSINQNQTTLIGLKLDLNLAGAAMIYYDDDGFAGIYLVGIKKHYQGQGLGKLLVYFCMEQIKKNGKDSCILQSTKAGFPLYNSMNFKKCGEYVLYWKI